LAAIKIPDRYSRGFAKIEALSASDVAKVVVSLGGAKAGTRREMMSLVSAALPDVASEDVKAFVETLQSLYGARTGMDLSIDEFVSSLVSAVKHSDDPEIRRAEPSELAGLENSLRELLDIQPLSMKAKARDLQREHSNTFCDARVITDLRPVFDVDIKSGPTGVVLSHSLKI